MVRPKTGWINITDICNNRCIGCYAENVCVQKEESTDTPMMPVSQVKELLGCVKQEGCVKCTLIGGEPTLHPNITEIFAKGNELGLKIGMVSNGRKFSDENFCETMISSGLKTGAVTFSMHAPSNELSFEFTKSKDAFSQFEKGLNNLLAKGVIPALNIALFRPMIYHIEKMILFAKDHGLKKVSFNLGAPTVGDPVSTHCLPPDELAEKVYEVFEFTQTMQLKSSFLFLIPFCLLERSKMQRLLDANAISSGCQIISGSGMLFNTKGDLIPCNHLTDHPVMQSCDILQIMRKGSFSEFWNSDKITSFRKSVCTFRSHHCIDCEWWNLCGGGSCSIFWTKYDPNLYIHGLGK